MPYATVQMVASRMELTGALLQCWRDLVPINVVRRSPDVLVSVMGNYHTLFSFLLGRINKRPLQCKQPTFRWEGVVYPLSSFNKNGKVVYHR